MSSKEKYGSFFHEGNGGNGNPEQMDDDEKEMEEDEKEDAGKIAKLRAAHTVEEQMAVIYSEDQAKERVAKMLNAIRDFNPNVNEVLKDLFDDYEQFLINNGVDVDDEDAYINIPLLDKKISGDNADTLLHYAIREGKLEAALHLIVKQGFNLEAKGNGDQTAAALLAEKHLKFDGLLDKFLDIDPRQEVPAPQFRS